MAVVQFNAFRPDLSRSAGVYFGVVIATILVASEAAFLSLRGWDRPPSRQGRPDRLSAVPVLRRA